MAFIPEQYNLEYITNSTGSYLTINLPAYHDVIHYQLQMLIHNHFSGILKTDSSRLNSGVTIYYDLTSMITMTRFLRKKTLNESQLINLLLDFTSILLNAQLYLLDEDKFVFDPDYIYINPSTNSPEILYLPLKSATNINQDIGLKGFIFRIITDMVNLNEGEVGMCLQKILSFLRKENANTKDFNIFLNDMLIKIKDEDLHTSQEQSSYEEENNEEITKPKCDMQDDELVEKDISHIIIVCVIQGVFFALYLVGIKILDTYNMHLAAKIALLLIVISLDLIMSLRLIGIKKKDSTDDAASNKELGGGAIPLVTAEETLSQFEQGKEEYEYNTVLLSQSDVGPYLFRVEASGNDEHVLIDKDCFVIGRQADQVDYAINNNAVGKIHAEIIHKERKDFFIIDLNSRNGTYLNNQRIDSNKEYCIIHNDAITFANSEFIFMLNSQ